MITNIRFNSIRYIDDILIILSGRKKDMKEAKIDKLINIMKCFYNNNNGVVLGIEEKGQSVIFLENKISIFQDKFDIEYLNKNENNIEEKKNQKITRFKSWKSYEPEEQKNELIIGFMTRI